MSEKQTAARQGRIRGQGGPGGPGFGMPVAKAKDFKKTVKRLIAHLSVYKFSLIFVFILAMASAAFSVYGPEKIGDVTNIISDGIISKISGGTGINFQKISDIVIFLVCLYVASSLFGYLQGHIMSGVSMKVTYKFRKDISEKINKLPLKYFDNTNQGEVLSKVTNDVETISQTLNQSLSQIIFSVTSVIGVLFMMFKINWILTLVSLGILPFSVIIIGVIMKISQRHFKEQQDYIGHINGHVEEMYGGHTVMKAFNGEERSINKFESLNNTLYKSAWKSQFLSGLMMPIMLFIGNIGYVAVCIVGGILAVRGSLKIGYIISFIQYVRQFNQPLAQLANIGNIFQQTAAAAERVFEFLDEEEEKPESSTKIAPSEIKGEVVFQNVHFGYNPEKIIINDFSAEIRPGQMVAIVGPTGAGKTTIVKLLMRFYDINSGAIFVDGHNIYDMRRNDLRSLFAMVLQDTWLYNGSIMENIRYGSLKASDEAVVNAAKAAHAHHFIKTLPDGYHMVLNEEASNVSGGQKQLLTIARAILADPKILILDEATSSVDTRTEVLIQRAMSNLMKGRTSFVIAHRLSTIRDADLILCMKDGDIVEQGTHNELLEKNGFYANLYNSQFDK